MNMKNTIAASVLTIFIITILWACGGGGSPAQLPPAPPPDEPAPITDKTIFIYDPVAEIIGTSDGEFYYDLDYGKSANARDGFISVGDVMHDIDVTGESRSTQRLPTTPDAITISGYVWCFENIYTDRWYTKVYRGSDEYGAWRDNNWKTVDAIATAGGDVIAIDDQNNYHSVAEPDLKIRAAYHNGIMVHSMDAVNRRAYIRGVDYDTRVAFDTNYFFQADQWIFDGDIWYSWNGYTWDGVTLSESTTILSAFIIQPPNSLVVIAAGTRQEHGETVTYWIDCNFGWLYRHTPSINALEMVIQLYQGSGLRSDGIDLKHEIKPVITADNLFYTWNGTVWKYDFDSGILNSFAASVEIWAM
jgi:hypothetical protein